MVRFFDATVRYEMVLWARVDLAVSGACGMKLGSFCALRAIAARDGSGRVQDAATDLGITVGAASKIADRLERGRWVRRRPHGSDGRSSVLEVTPDGAAVLERGLRVMAEALDDHLAPVLTGDQLDAAARLLEDLTAASATGRRRAPG